MKKIIYFIATLFGLFVADAAIAQCCAAGNPVGGDGSQDAMKKNQLSVFAAYRYSYSRDYYHLSQKEDIQNIEKSFYNYGSLSLSYGINWRFTLHSEMGYYFDKVQVVNLTGGQETIEAKGIGDMSLNLRYSLLPQKIVNENRLVFSLGGRFPVGQFNEVQDGVKIPVALQPSSGALKVNSSLFYSHKNEDAQIGWSAFAFFEWSNQINEGLIVYKYGNLFLLEATAFYPVKSSTVISLSSKAEFRSMDKKENDLGIESSGGMVLYIKPKIQLKIAHDLYLHTFGEVPVYKYVNGYQLTNLFAFQVGLRKSFSL
ncbi:MAG: hypothetical protein K9H16_14555 [Bacteroidales bacterium]|nr:hypothetical protein [Bacteroidales bacterium]